MKFETQFRSFALKWYESIVNFLNGIPSFLFILIIICGNLLTKKLHANEEHYFALAKQFYDSNWLPNSFSFNDWPGEKLLFQYVAGFLLHYFGFEKTALLGKLLTYLMISYPLGLLIKKVNLSNLDFFFLFQLVFLIHQNFFANEWMIGGFEPKTLAYPFVIFGIIYVLDNKWYKAIVFMAIATCFHFLIGGWFTLILLIYKLFNGKNFKAFLFIALLYAILIFPYFLYLLNGTLKIPGEMNGVKYDWLIVYFRNPHHAAIFNSFNDFFFGHLKGILELVAATLVSFVFLYKVKNQKLKSLNRIILITFGLIFLFLIVGLFDKSGFFLKFLPYRTESIGLLLFLMVAMGFLNEKLNHGILKKQLVYIVLTFTAPLFLYNVVLNTNNIVRHKTDNYSNFYNYIDENTKPTDVFEFVGFHDVYSIGPNIELSFPRKTRRDLFVLFKFVPYGEKIYEWYDRLNELMKIEENVSHVWKTKEKYKLDYIISNKQIEENGFTPVFKDDGLYLYKLEQ